MYVPFQNTIIWSVLHYQFWWYYTLSRMFISMLSKFCVYTCIENYLDFVTNAQRLITRGYHKTKYAFHPYNTARYDNRCYVIKGGKRFCIAFAFSPRAVPSATLPHSSHHEQTYSIYNTCLLGFQRYCLCQGVPLREFERWQEFVFFRKTFHGWWYVYGTNINLIICD